MKTDKWKPTTKQLGQYKKCNVADLKQFQYGIKKKQVKQ